MSTTAQLKNRLSKAFTLIEVLVVIGILGILATVALVAINPAEAQKKARDTQRLKDMATLQSIVEQHLNDNPGASNALITGGNKDSSMNSSGKTCNNSWFGNTVNFCPYAAVIPVDPSNRTTSVTSGTGTVSAKSAYYYFKIGSGGYKICTYLESTSNAAKVLDTNDGGVEPNMFEVYSDQTISTCE